MFLMTSCDKCGKCVQADIEQILDKEVNIICKLCGEEKNKMEKENNQIKGPNAEGDKKKGKK